MSASKASVALGIGLGGIALTAVGFFASDPRSVALSWLVAVGYWTLIAVGALILVFLHHIFDASWGTAIRRQFEHGLAAFRGTAFSLGRCHIRYRRSAPAVLPRRDRPDGPKLRRAL